MMPHSETLGTIPVLGILVLTHQVAQIQGNMRVLVEQRVPVLLWTHVAFAKAILLDVLMMRRIGIAQAIHATGTGRPTNLVAHCMELPMVAHAKSFRLAMHGNLVVIASTHKLDTCSSFLINKKYKSRTKTK